MNFIASNDNFSYSNIFFMFRHHFYLKISEEPKLGLGEGGEEDDAY